MRTSFDNHIRNSFSSMPNIQVYPFLNLKDERFFGNILNSHSCWVWTVKGKSSHNNNRIFEFSFNFNSVPCFSIWLFHGDFTIFNNSIVTWKLDFRIFWSNLWGWSRIDFDNSYFFCEWIMFTTIAHVFVKIFYRKVFPFFVINTELPSGFSSIIFFSSKDFKSLHSRFRRNGEFKFSVFDTIILVFLNLLNWFTIKGNKSTILVTIWESKVISRSITDWECEFKVVTNVLVGFTMTNLFVSFEGHIRE